MARIRSVKPELRDSELVASWPFEARYFWVLFWGYLDDFGRGLDLPKRIAGDCFPYDDIDSTVIDKWLDMMSVGRDDEQGPVCRYKVGGKAYVHAVNWSEHQRPNRPTPSRLPPCPTHESLTESLNGSSLPGAAEQQRRGAEEQQQAARELFTPKATDGMRETVMAATGANEIEADAVIAYVDADRKPRNLGAFLRTLAKAGDLAPLLAEVRGIAAKIDRDAILAAARDGPPCEHGKAGGDVLHPDSGKPRCLDCRLAAERKSS